MKQPCLKWIDLWKLSSIFVHPKLQKLQNVYYFSAYATWLKEAHKRHLQYVWALKSTGVTVELSPFFEKDRSCKACGANWVGHEEKQSDVKIALWMFDQATRDEFDRALLITRDSDLAPAIRMLEKRCPEKKIIVIAPPGRRHSKDLIKQIPSRQRKTILPGHLISCLLP